MGFRQEECRPGACCLWFVALLHVPGSWSSCVFRASTVVAFWGAVFISARILLELSCLLCWLAALRGAGGAFGADSWLVFYRVLVLAVRLEVRVVCFCA